MIDPQKIEAIEARAKAANVSIYDITSRAGVNGSTWRRWRAGTYGPQMGTWDKIVRAIEYLESIKPSSSTSQ